MSSVYDSIMRYLGHVFNRIATKSCNFDSSGERICARSVDCNHQETKTNKCAFLTRQRTVVFSLGVYHPC